MLHSRGGDGAYVPLRNGMGPTAAPAQRHTLDPAAGEDQCRHSAVSPSSGFQPGAISGSGSSAVSTSGGNGDGS